MFHSLHVNQEELLPEEGCILQTSLVMSHSSCVFIMFVVITDTWLNFAYDVDIFLFDL